MVPKKVNPELMLLRELIDEWLADVVHLTLAESSHERYSQLARDHVNPHIGDVPVKELSPKHLRALMTLLLKKKVLKKKLSQRTVDLVMTAISGACSHGVEMGYVDTNAVRSFRWRKGVVHKCVPQPVATVRPTCDRRR